MTSSDKTVNEEAGDQEAARNLVIDVLARSGVKLDDEDALDAELLSIANRSGSTLIHYHFGHTREMSYLALKASVDLAAALRAVLGYSTTPTTAEVLTTMMAADGLRPEVCPECYTLGLCAPGCATAAAKRWAREATA